MGVPGLYTWLKKKIREISTFQSDRELIVTGIWLDFNGIIHGVRNDTELELMGEKKITDELFLLTFRDKLYRFLTIEIIKQYKPKLIGIMVDGIAPIAKVNEQRKRRYQVGEVKLKKFSSLAITPGTDFMMKIDSMIREFILNPWIYIREYDDSFSLTENMEIIYSSHLCPGEGEQKIMDNLRNTYTNGVHIIYGDDADLLLMLPLLERDSLYVVHGEQGDNGKNYVTIPIDYVRTVIGMFHISTLDFLLIVTLAGNDFVPGTPSVIVKNLDTIIEMYSNLKNSNDSETRITSLVDKIDGQFQISLPEFFSFLVSLANTEFMRLEERSRIKPTTTALRIALIEDDDKIKFVPDIFRAFWYRRALGPRTWSGGNDERLACEKYLNPTSLSSMVANYFFGLSWVVDYYTGQDVSQEWYYPIDYAPLISEMVTTQFDPIEFDDSGYRRTIFDNLLMVIPLWHKQLVPKPFQVAMDDTTYIFNSSDFGRMMFNSPVSDLFPREIIVDKDVSNNQKGISIIPPLDIHRIRTVVISCIAYLTKQKDKQVAIDNAKSIYDKLVFDRVGYRQYRLEFETGKSERKDIFDYSDIEIKMFMTRGKNPKYLDIYKLDYIRKYKYIPSDSYRQLVAENYVQLRSVTSKGDYSVLPKSKVYKSRKKKNPNPKTIGVGDMGLFYPVETFKEIAVQRKIPSNSGTFRAEKINIRVKTANIDWTLTD